jgi:hypothetical protein
MAREIDRHPEAAAAMKRGNPMVVKRIRESSPLWVWFAVALLAIGTLSYVAVVTMMEYLMAAAS